MYEYQGFHSGEKLKATQLVALEDGIINVEKLIMATAESAANMEKGTGDIATQQVPRQDKVTIQDGETTPHFNFTGHPDAGMSGRVQYGAVGNYSASMNGRSAALNKHAFAINNSTVAKGEESFAQGYETVAEGNSSFAGGSKTWAKGAAAVALGSETKATGDYSFANGVKTIAGYNYQTVVGVGNDNNVESLFEVGNAELDADGNIVEPSTAFRVMRNGKVKIKDIWAKEDDDVIALGFLKYCLNDELLPKIDTHINQELSSIRSSITNITEESKEVKQYHVLTSGREDKNSIQMPSCTASGNWSVALGHSSSALNSYSMSCGSGSTADAAYAVAIGANTSAEGEAAVAIGVNASAIGPHSRAFGTNTVASGAYSTAIGREAVANGETSTAIGYGSSTGEYADCAFSAGKKAVAGGSASIAMGYEAIADGTYSISLGCNTIAHVPYAIAMGARAEASGEAAFAVGVDAYAAGVHSRAMGTNVNAGHAYQTVIGKNNDNKEGTLFEIGNGADADNPGNAFEVYTEGDVAIRYNGQMYSLQKILEIAYGFPDEALI